MLKDNSTKLLDFFNLYPVRNYQRGQILIYTDDKPNDVFYICAGRVRQYLISDEGNDIVVNINRQGTYFPGLPSHLSHKSSEYFFDAMSDVSLKVAPMPRFIDYLRLNPELLMDSLMQAQVNNEDVLRRMSYVMAKSAYYRLAYELVLECQQNGYTGEGLINLPIHEYELANQAGVSRETASRELKKLKTKGLISVSRKFITVKNFLKLRKELGNHF